MASIVGRRPPALVVLSLALIAAGPSAWSQQSPFMGFGSRVTPPIGFLTFCLQEPVKCGLDRSELRKPEAQAAIWRSAYWSVFFAETPLQVDPGLEHTPVITLNPAALATLERVDLTINHQIRFDPDEAGAEVTRGWHLPLKDGTMVGDCADIALEKRRALVEEGFASDALSLALAQTPAGTHVVLLVATNRGELVLDSLSEHVLNWRELDYHWISRQLPGHPLIWTAVEPGVQGEGTLG